MAGYLPNITITASARGADAVATLPGAVFSRKLAGGSINGPTGSKVALYLGAINDSARFDQNSRGQSNSFDYASPRSIPPNTPVLVVWPGQGTKSSQCSATLSFAE